MQVVRINNTKTKQGWELTSVYEHLYDNEENGFPRKSSVFSIWVRLGFVVSCIAVALLMVMSKLFPVIPCSWPESFCTKWNDFWFSISSSLLAAIIFYCASALLLQKTINKRNVTMARKEVMECVCHAGTIYACFRNKEIYNTVTKEEVVEDLCSFDWFAMLESPNHDNAQKFADLILQELVEAKKCLMDIILLYKDSLSYEDRTILVELKSHPIFHWINNGVSVNAFKDDQYAIKMMAGLLFDFYASLYKFATR